MDYTLYRKDNLTIYDNIMGYKLFLGYQL